MPGGLLKKRERSEGEIPTASMADIAFLLLIFFLVTTTIDVDTGIGMTLPPPLEEEQEPPPVKERNMLKILINAEGQVLLEDEPSAVSLIRDEVKTHVTNNGQDPNYAESPGQAVVSIKTDQNTPYQKYIEVLDEVWMAYFEIWDGAARSGQVTNQPYPNYRAYRSTLLPGEENAIKEAFPAQISLAEPDTG